jgi:hypothetical protein
LIALEKIGQTEGAAIIQDTVKIHIGGKAAFTFSLSLLFLALHLPL